MNLLVHQGKDEYKDNKFEIEAEEFGQKNWKKWKDKFKKSSQNVLSFGFTDELPEEIATKIWVNTDSGIPKMTIGLSIMYSPFFLMAHGYSKLRGTPNGYSAPYHLMLLFAGLFYGIMGLFVLKKLLLIYFDQLVGALAGFCISLGTNLYHYVGYDGAMSHVYSFFLFAVFVYYSLVWNKNPNNINSLIMGIAGGLIVLVRPANCLIWILPFLIAVQSTSTLKTKIDWLRDDF